ncbi:putative CCR4-associated factor 1 homolog 8 [Spinacia oleracea]|uniref:CCR4-associated factor 1 homolog 8 n=1 Tax=Spinacia oleracea TaxID=3562 RepID=A0ABM3QLS2_SPIOL|nr:putative CCR4-associated factor 1 homolog 8 [Spinacia oleracea]
MKNQLEVVQVSTSNLDEQIDNLSHKLDHYPNISIDTEFGWFKRDMNINGTDLEIYEDLKYNLTHSNLREIGMTVSDNGGEVGGTWRFDFFPSKKAGITLRDCIPTKKFITRFKKLMQDFHGKVKWFTFAGYFDVAHLVSLLERKPLPELIKSSPATATTTATTYNIDGEEGFVEVVQRYFGKVYDLKVIAKHYENLFGKNKYLGLQRLANQIGVKRVGREHDGASDSLLTAGIFAKFIEFGWISDSDQGFLSLLPHQVCYDSTKMMIQTKNEEDTSITTSTNMEPAHQPYPRPVNGPVTGYPMGHYPVPQYDPRFQHGPVYGYGPRPMIGPVRFGPVMSPGPGILRTTPYGTLFYPAVRVFHHQPPHMISLVPGY